MREAKKNHPDLISYSEKVKQAKEDRAIAISDALLQVEAAASAKSAKTATKSSTDTYLYSVTGEQLIFNGFKTSHDISSSEKTLEAEEYNYGGLMGILLGVLTSVTLSFLAGWATKVTISNIFLAAGFSIAVGMFFGLWPAKKHPNLIPSKRFGTSSIIF